MIHRPANITESSALVLRGLRTNMLEQVHGGNPDKNNRAGSYAPLHINFYRQTTNGGGYSFQINTKAASYGNE